MDVVLVDTSAWILAVHRKEAKAQERLVEIIARGQAAVCPIVLLEWLAGRGRGENPRSIRERFSALAMLPCDDEVWERAYALAAEARSRGHTLPPADALVAAHAIRADAVLLHADSDFVRIASWSSLKQISLLPG